MSKSRDAFRTISEVSDVLDTPAHVLRFWESKFSQVKPVKRAGGRRYYRPGDVDLLAGIKQLLHDDGMTIKGAQKLLREQGVKHVTALGQAALGDDADAPDVVDMEPAPEPQQAEPLAPEPANPEPDTPATVPVADTPPPPKVSVSITNVVPMAATAEPPNEPAVPNTLSARPVAAPAPPAAIKVPADPADADSKLPARLFHLIHKAPPERLAARAEAIAPLLDRMQVLRDRIDTR